MKNWELHELIGKSVAPLGQRCTIIGYQYGDGQPDNPNPPKWSEIQADPDPFVTLLTDGDFAMCNVLSLITSEEEIKANGLEDEFCYAKEVSRK